MTNPKRSPRGLGQKIALTLAYASYVGAVALAVVLATYEGETGTADSIIASIMASIVFLGGVGIVLHVVGRANLPDLSIPRDDPSM